MDWQPIETAPKDGTIVFLLLSEEIDRYYVSPDAAKFVCVGFFGSSNGDFGQHNLWCSVEAKEEMWGMGGELTGPMTSTECIQVKPSHWMPIPEAP